MTPVNSSISDEVRAFCSRVGANPLLVQGAGGNASWKDDDTLWVKASGTWLADAESKEIFVPVELPSLRHAMKTGDFDATPTVRGDSALRPSIETMLHALLPHRVVVHLHPVDILAHLVRDQFSTGVHALLGDEQPWISVPYKKPGAELAAEVDRALQDRPGCNIVFLQSHGVVIGGKDVLEVSATLDTLIKALQKVPAQSGTGASSLPAIGHGYSPVADPDLHQLATVHGLYQRLDSQWALYPDHVVFLGPTAQKFPDVDALNAMLQRDAAVPELVFIEGLGVFAQGTFSVAKLVQLRCYYDVLVRLDLDDTIRSLSPFEIGQLLNWDAEQYRMRQAK